MFPNPNLWVTCDGRTIITAVQTAFVRKRVRKIVKELSPKQITVWPSQVTHRLRTSFLNGEFSNPNEAIIIPLHDAHLTIGT